MKLISGFLLLVIGCSNAQFTQHKPQPSQPFEEMVSKGLEIFAESSKSCQEQKIALVKKDKSMIQNLVGQVKGLTTGETPKVSLKGFKTHFSLVDTDQFDMIYQILTNEGFQTVVSQTADVIKSVANNDIIIGNLTAIRDDLNLEPGDRIAEILNLLASDSARQEILLGAAHSALCENLSEQDIIGVLLSPKVLWTLGPNATYLLGSPLMKHAKPLFAAVKKVSIPDELSQFVALVKDMMPKQNICSVTSLEPYQKHFELVLSLLKAGDTSNTTRPLRSFLNTLFRLYTMDESNQCAGMSFDDLKKENIQNAFLTLSNFLIDEQHGVMGVLKQIRPRQ